MANEKPPKRGYRAVVDDKVCKPYNCLKCVEACKFLEAISQGENGPVVNLGECCGCGECAEECPNKAIKILLVEVPQPPRLTW